MKPPPISPRFWPSWLLVGFAACVARLPLRAQFAVGRSIGALLYRFAPRRRHIAQINIALCFPELDAAQRGDLVQRVFRSTGIGAVETAIAWFRDPRRYARRVKVTGLEHVQAAQKLGRGVLLVGAHFATLDLAGALLSLFADIDVMYRYSKNPVIEWLMRRGRERLYGGVIERSDARTVLTRLKEGRMIWYAADQDYGRKMSVFVPFFGVPAATITATSRLARRNNSAVLFFGHWRDESSRTWSIDFSPTIDGFPSNDDAADAVRMNQIIETAIRRHPDQYLWLHRRFKTRPPGVPRPY